MNINAKSFNIKFLEWVEIDKDDLVSMGIASDENTERRAYISPDVKSLHLVWIEMNRKAGNLSWYHEMVDYVSFIFVESDEDISLIQTILQDELFDDSYDCGDERNIQEFYKNVLSDYGDDRKAPEVMKLSKIMKEN